MIYRCDTCKFTHHHWDQFNDYVCETPSEPAVEPLVELLREAGLKERINMDYEQASADKASACRFCDLTAKEIYQAGYDDAVRFLRERKL